eukprot:1705993-Rhodomonas_salina.1
MGDSEAARVQQLDTCAYVHIHTHTFSCTPVRTHPIMIPCSTAARLGYDSQHSTHAYQLSTPYAYDPAIESSLNSG